MVRHFNLELGIFWDDPTTPEGQAPERNYVYLLRSTISDDLLKEASSLYSNHFGFWISEDIGRGTWRLSSRVKLSARRLREGYLFNDDCFISHVCDPASGKLIGYAFGTTAPDPTSPLNSGKKIMWITQIVVHKDFRSDRTATHLIAAATEKFPTLSILGIVSPHPWAIRAVMRGRRRHAQYRLGFYRTTWFSVSSRRWSTVRERYYVLRLCFRQTRLGPLPNAPNFVSLVHTLFHTEHEWWMRILQEEKKERGWWLGDLPEGHEFFLVVRKK